MKRIIQEWIELANGCLEDGPPKTSLYRTWLFTNRCQVRQTPKGKIILARQLEVVELKDATKDALNEQLAQFVEQPDVRLLKVGLGTNDWDILPRSVTGPAQDLLDGTASIYQSKEPTAESDVQ